MLRHPSNLPKQTEQLPSWTILHYEHIKVVSLDKIVHPNHEWMVNLLIDVSLVQHQLPTLLAGESWSVHEFCSVEMTVIQATDYVYLAEATNCNAFAEFVHC